MAIVTIAIAIVVSSYYDYSNPEPTLWYMQSQDHIKSEPQGRKVADSFLTSWVCAHTSRYKPTRLEPCIFGCTRRTWAVFAKELSVAASSMSSCTSMLLRLLSAKDGSLCTHVFLLLSRLRSVIGKGVRMSYRTCLAAGAVLSGTDGKALFLKDHLHECPAQQIPCRHCGFPICLVSFW